MEKIKIMLEKELAKKTEAYNKAYKQYDILLNYRQKTPATLSKFGKVDAEIDTLNSCISKLHNAIKALK